MSFFTPGAIQHTSYFFIDAGLLRAHLDQTSEKLFGAQKFEIDYKKLRGIIKISSIIMPRKF